MTVIAEKRERSVRTVQGIEGWEKEVTCATDYLEGRVGSVLVRHGGGGGGGGGLEGGVRWTVAADWGDECGYGG